MSLLKQYILIFSVVVISACGGGGSSDPTPAADTTAPNISSANPTNNSVISSLASVVLTFSEDVSGADVLLNYSLSGTGVGTLLLNSVTYTNNIATVAIDGLVANGSVTLNLDNVTDQAGNPLPAYTLTLSGSTVSPTQSALPASGSNNLTALTTVEVTYSKDVVNADNTANYALSGTAAAGLTLDSAVLKIATTRTYVLSFGGVLTDGILNIDISNVEDVVGTALVGTNISYTLDVTAPEISTSVPAAGSLTTTAPTSISLHYTEAVTGNDLLANFSLSGTAVGGADPLTISSLIAINASQSVINLSGVALDGDLTLTADNIIDPAGNTLTGGNTVTVSIDPVTPTRTWDPVDQTVLSSLSTVTVTYSEPVINGDNPASYQLMGNSKGDLAITGVVNSPANSNTYVISFSGNLLEGLTFKDIALVSGFPMVTDLAGNNVTSQVQWTVDQTAPTLTTVLPVQKNLSMLSLNNVTVEFSEAMSADVLDPANYLLEGSGVGSLVLGTPVLSSGNVYNIPVTGTPAFGNVLISISAKDAAGNAASERIGYSFGTPATITSRTTNITSDIRSLASNGGEIIAIGDSSWILHSTDGGVSWANVAMDQSSGDAFYCRGGSPGLKEIVYANGKWTAIGGIKGPNGSTILGTYASTCSSSDGTSWTNVPAAGDGDGVVATTAHTVYSGIVHDGTNYIAVGKNPASTNATTWCLHSTSADAVTWPVTPAYCKTLSSVTVSTQPNGVHYVNGNYFITGNNSLLGPVLSRKSDIADTVLPWSAVSTSFQEVEKIIHDGTRYLVAGTIANEASIGYSTDLVSWTYVTAGSGKMLDIGYDASGGYIAVGSSGNIITSTSSDGMNWTNQKTGSDKYNAVLWDATAANWVVVGFNGVALTVVVP